MAKSAKRTTAMIVDDHRLFREGIRDLLTRNAVEVVAEVGDAADAVAAAAETRPQVALMDLRLQGASGVEATERVRRVSPTTHVLALTMSTSERDVAEALRAGACGYLLKDSSEEEIVAGVKAAARGHSPLSPSIASLMLERLRGSMRAIELPEDGAPELTERELEVLCMIAAGKENGEIATTLVISEHTVKNHVSSVLTKLGVDNRIQAAVYAVRKRLA